MNRKVLGIGVDLSKTNIPTSNPELLRRLGDLSPGMLESVSKLIPYEAKILHYINANHEHALEFLLSPKSVFLKLEIPLDKELAEKLDFFAEKNLALNLIRPTSIELPSGRKIDPKIRVKFTR
jgi:hypothetical protein